MVKPYEPVACAFHERLEFAVLRRQRLRLRYRDGEAVAEAVILPLDVYTRDGAEWLVGRLDDGKTRTWRLDLLSAAEPIAAE